MESLKIVQKFPINYGLFGRRGTSGTSASANSTTEMLLTKPKGRLNNYKSYKTIGLPNNLGPFLWKNGKLLQEAG